MKKLFCILLMMSLLAVPAFANEMMRNTEKANPLAKIHPDLLEQLGQDAASKALDGQAAPIYRVIIELENRQFKSQDAMTRAFANRALEQDMRADIANMQRSVVRSMRAEKSRAGANFQIWNLYKSTYAFSA
ncbi:MAG: hypothetical protein AAGM22_30835, partial [Acidobacteriota bacterium]